jgi:hypothetical protein
MLARKIKVSCVLVHVAAWAAPTARRLAELAVRTSTLTLVNYIHVSYYSNYSERGQRLAHTCISSVNLMGRLGAILSERLREGRVSPRSVLNNSKNAG